MTLNPRRIACLTGGRADYSHLYPILKGISQSPQLELQLLACGTHLSSEHGRTIREVQADGFEVSEIIEHLLDSDSRLATIKSSALALLGLGEALERLQPDILLLLGDRYETFLAASAATLMGIPLAHLHGGETTQGAFDEAFRHSITKMSHLHFVATKEYRARVIQLGESPSAVYLVGAPILESLNSTHLYPLIELSAHLPWDWEKPYVVITFHPTTLDSTGPQEQVQDLLAALQQSRFQLLFTAPNADPGGREIGEEIRDFVKAHEDRAVFVPALGRTLYLSSVAHSAGVVGNSSSGLIEAPSLGVGTVNIGNRQRGRIAGPSVIDCAPDRAAIARAMETLDSAEHRALCSKKINPYWQGPVSEVVVKTLGNCNLSSILEKSFFDLPFDPEQYCQPM